MLSMSRYEDFEVLFLIWYHSIWGSCVFELNFHTRKCVVYVLSNNIHSIHPGIII